MSNNDLVQELQSRQQEEELTSTEFAAKLGISHSTLSRIYSGERRPGPKLLGGILNAYPDLQDMVALFLSAEITEVTLDVAIVTAGGGGDHG